MASRKGIGRRFGRRKRPRSRLEELTAQTREEGRSLTRRQRIDARRAVRAQSEGFEELGVRLRGTAFELRRHMRPVLAPAGRLVAWVAPYITGTLLFAIKLFAALIALIAELGRVTAARVARTLTGLAGVTSRALRRHVRPLPTVAFVGAAAAIGLGVSQFFDYHGVAVDAPAYAGEVGGVAPAPLTGTATAGSAHLWILLPVALAALVLVALAYRGGRRLAAGVALCGLLGIAVAVAIDLPQGLDAGRPGLAFSGAQAELLQGFWAEIASSAVLILCGGLLALYSGDTVRAERRRSHERARGSAARRDVGGISPGLQTES